MLGSGPLDVRLSVRPRLGMLGFCKGLLFKTYLHSVKIAWAENWHKVFGCNRLTGGLYEIRDYHPLN